MSQLTETTDQLTLFEVNELAHHEGVIAHGLETFVDVGQSLMLIRDRQLYRAKYTTFADYCRKRWKIGKSRAYQLIGAAEVFENVHRGGQTDGDSEPVVAPTTERQTRPLTKLPAEEQAGAWNDAVERSGGEPTAKDVEAVVAERLEPEHTPLVQHLTGTDEWYTPQVYLDAAGEVMGGIDLDPASSELANQRVCAKEFYDNDPILGQTTLSRPWFGRRLWLNPPYSNTAAWVEKWCASVEASGMAQIESAILLVFANTDTRWFQPLWKHWLCFTDHRIRFERPDGSVGDAPPKGSVFAYAGPEPERFARVFSQFGAIVPPAWNNDHEENGGNIP